MQDLRFAVRSLHATPVVTAVAILSLALGIGANTAMFSLVNRLLLRRLPVVDSERLAVVSENRAIKGGFTAGWTYNIWEQIHQRAQPIADGSCAWATDRFNLAEGGGEAQPVDGIYATGDYFATLGVPALLGRTFTSEDDQPGGGKNGPVAVISYALWQRRFGGAETIVGNRITVERLPFTIIGVMPPAFFGAEVGRLVDIALPLNAEPMIRGKDSRIAPDKVFYGLTVLLRLKRDQTIDTATAMLRGVQPQIREAAMPTMLPPLAQKGFLQEPFTVVSASVGTSRLRARYERPLAAIFFVVALVLLIACGNIANLQLARAGARRHELSVRVALGASNWRLVRQWLAESLMLSGIGATLGLLFAGWSTRALVAQLSTSVNRVYLDLSLDWRVLAFTAGVAVGTALVFGTAPAWRHARTAPIDAMKEQTRGSVGDRRMGLSGGLVISQVALSVVIVVAAGLFVRTFEKLATMPLGFDSERVLVVNANLSRTRVQAAERVTFVERLAHEVAGIPGVERAAASMTTPVGGFGMVDSIRVPGVTPSLVPMVDGKLGPQSALARVITPGWFATYGIALRAGRDVRESDVKESPAVIVVNESFARKFLSGQQPIGATVAFERGRDAAVIKTVVGIVGDSIYQSLREDAAPVEYVPMTQLDWGPIAGEVSVSARAPAQMLVPLERSVAAALTGLDSDLTFTFRRLRDQVSESLVQERLVAVLSRFFGLLALLLAGLGLYGVTSYAITRRRMEIGIRMALGAAPAGVMRLVMARVSVLVGVGVMLGAGLSFWATQFVRSLLYGLEPRDPVTLATAVVTLAVVGTVAGGLPAWRASRIDPAEVLRES